MDTQIQNSKTQEMKEKIKKLLDQMQELEQELVDYVIHEAKYEDVKELADDVYVLYSEAMDINKAVYSVYAGMYLDRPSAGLTDISEDIENSFVKDFIDFVTDLPTYNVEQLYNYIKEEYISKDEEEWIS